MHIFILLVLALQAAVAQPKTMSQLMIDPIYPASDAIFYISTRTPANDADWRALVGLNDALYTSCVQCHQDYRPNYGRRELPGAAAAGSAQPAPSTSAASA